MIEKDIQNLIKLKKRKKFMLNIEMRCKRVEVVHNLVPLYMKVNAYQKWN
jgi:uncharacterized protein with von Willebrand factor type A (vWA) domain